MWDLTWLCADIVVKTKMLGCYVGNNTSVYVSCTF